MCVVYVYVCKSFVIGLRVWFLWCVLHVMVCACVTRVYTYMNVHMYLVCTLVCVGGFWCAAMFVLPCVMPVVFRFLFHVYVLVYGVCVCFRVWLFVYLCNMACSVWLCEMWCVMCRMWCMMFVYCGVRFVYVYM